jgi:hypothetical protein
MRTLVETIEKELDPSIACLELETLKNVIEDLDFCFLTGPQIEELSKKMLTLLHESEINK